MNYLNARLPTSSKDPKEITISETLWLGMDNAVRALFLSLQMNNWLLWINTGIKTARLKVILGILELSAIQWYQLLYQNVKSLQLHKIFPIVACMVYIYHSAMICP